MAQDEGVARPISEDEDIGPYRLSSPMEVAFILRHLAQRADFLTVFFNGGRDLMLTRILYVNLKEKFFVFDLSGHQASNAALQKADRAIFVGLPDGVKVQFSTRNVTEVSFEGSPALMAPFPSDVIKLQRREFFRLPTPRSNPYFCRIALPNLEAVRMEIHDVSLGGVGVWFPKALVDRIEIGQIVAQVMFDLGPGGVMRMDTEIRNCRPVENRQGQTQYIAGLKFINIARNQESSLQKLISHLERERKALLG